LAQKSKIQIEIEYAQKGLENLGKGFTSAFAEVAKSLKVSETEITKFTEGLKNAEKVSEKLGERLEQVAKTSTKTANAYSQVFSKKEAGYFSSYGSHFGNIKTQAFDTLLSPLKEQYEKQVATFKLYKDLLGRAKESDPNNMGFISMLAGKTSSAGKAVGQDFFDIDVFRNEASNRIDYLKNKFKSLSAEYESLKTKGGANIKELANVTKKELDTVKKELDGNKKGFSAMSASIIGDIKNLMAWQARWYIAKTLIFLPGEALMGGVKAYSQWQQSMKNAAAVSEYTAEDMKILKDVTIEIGKTTPISASEASKALLEFAQAGISATDAQTMLPLAAKMVIATQEDMKTSVSALTTAFYAWKVSAKDMPQIADQIAASMADSKLKVADLATIFNYLGTTAKQANMSVKDTLTLVTVLSKAGVQPSTIGTGLTQAIIAFTRMQPKVKDMLTRNKLDWREFVIPENKPLEVFKKLANVGLPLEDVFKGLEVRAGRSLAAILNQALSMIDETEKNVERKGFLNKAFETSMGGIENQLKRFKGIIESELILSLDTAGEGFSKLLKYINDVISGVEGLNTALRVLIYSTLSYLTIQLGKWLFLKIGLIGAITTLFKFLSNTFVVLGFAGGIKHIGLALSGLLGPLALVSIALGVIITFFIKVNETMKETQARINEMATSEWDKKTPFAKKHYYNMIEEIQRKRKNNEFVPLGDYQNVGAAGQNVLGQPGPPSDEQWGGFYSKIQSAYLSPEGLYGKEYDYSKIATGGRPESPDYTSSYFGKKLSDLNKFYSEKERIIKDNEKEELNIIENLKKKSEISEEESLERKLKSTEKANDAEIVLLYEKLEKLNTAYFEGISKVKPNKENTGRLLSDIYDDYSNAYDEVDRKIREKETETANKRRDVDTSLFLYKKDLMYDYFKYWNDMAQKQVELSAEYADQERDIIGKQISWLYNKNLISASEYFGWEKRKIIESTKQKEDGYDEEYNLAQELYKKDMALAGEDSKKKQKAEEDYMGRLSTIGQKIVKNRMEQRDKLDELNRQEQDSVQLAYDKGGFGGVVTKSLELLGNQYRNTAGNIQQATNNMVQALEDGMGSFFDYMSDKFMDFEAMALDVLHTIYMEFVKTILIKQWLGAMFGTATGGATGQGFLSTILGSIFGGGRASGGYVSVNKPYVVGERGPELFVPGASGNIIPNSGMSSPVSVEINVENSTPIPLNLKTTSTATKNNKHIINAVIEDYNSYGRMYHLLSGGNK